MSGFEPGEVYMVTCKTPPTTFAAVRDHKGWNSLDPGIGFAPDSDVVDARPLALIDPDDDKAVEALATLILTGQGVHRAPTPGELSIAAEALREFADPKPPTYREHQQGWAPWPLVNECHSRHHEDHECPQCAWEHEHDWVAWLNDSAGRQCSGSGVPIRCAKCGGRKCDADGCALMRHTHTHDEERS